MNIALVLSGGTGVRVHSSIPKQYIEVGGKPIISYCLETLAASPHIDAIQIVADEAWHEFLRSIIGQPAFDEVSASQSMSFLQNTLSRKFMGFSPPGENRQLSILNGLTDIRRNLTQRRGAGTTDAAGFCGESIALIHDAARPMVSQQQIVACLEAAANHAGAMPVLPMKDTVYYSEDGGSVTQLLDRSRIFAGQAPEAFKLETYYQANMALLPDRILKIRGSTEPAIMAGLDIAMIPGEESNFKITTLEDLQRFRQMVKKSDERGAGL